MLDGNKNDKNVRGKEKPSAKGRGKLNVTAPEKPNVSAKGTKLGARRKRESARPNYRRWRTSAASSRHRLANWQLRPPRFSVEILERAHQPAGRPLRRLGDVPPQDRRPHLHHRCANQGSTRRLTAGDPAAPRTGQTWKR